MTELMLKMTLWLVAAIALGFIFGWLLAKAVQKKKYDEELNALDSALLDRSEMLEKLEKKFRNEKLRSQKISQKLEQSEEDLAEKTSMVTQLQVKLNKINSSQNSMLDAEKSNKMLQKQLKLLEERDFKRVNELKEFESVLLKSEKMLEENQARYEAKIIHLEEQIERLTLENEEKLKSVELYQDTIAEFEEELKLYTASSEDDKFVISKDQFTQIEEQLEIYQKEILALKNENNDLRKKSKEKIESNIEKELISESLEVDDGSIVKRFRETYKKITKS